MFRFRNIFPEISPASLLVHKLTFEEGNSLKKSAIAVTVFILAVLMVLPVVLERQLFRK